MATSQAVQGAGVASSALKGGPAGVATIGFTAASKAIGGLTTSGNIKLQTPYGLGLAAAIRAKGSQVTEADLAALPFADWRELGTKDPSHFGQLYQAAYKYYTERGMTGTSGILGFGSKLQGAFAALGQRSAQAEAPVLAAKVSGPATSPGVVSAPTPISAPPSSAPATTPTVGSGAPAAFPTATVPGSDVTVVPVTGAPAPLSSQAPTSVGPGPVPVTTGGTAPATSAAPATTGGTAAPSSAEQVVISVATRPVVIAGRQIPLWILGALAVLAVYLFRHKG